MQKLHSEILEQADLNPDAVALQLPAESAYITYRQLHTEAIQLCASLESLGFPTGSIIAIYLPKSVKAIVAILATLMADLAYLPLDVDAPDQRNQYLLNQSQASALLSLAGSEPGFLQRKNPVVDSVAGLSLQQIPRHTPKNKWPDDLAYVLYTSGSTGFPKGVMITHSGAWAFVDWAKKTFTLSPNDVLTSIAPLHFDLSVFDIFAGLSAGASVVLLLPEEAKNPMLLSSYMERYGVTTIYATPTLLQLMPRFGKADQYDHRKLRQVLFAGEVFPIPALRALQGTWATAAFYNLYGPTETNVCTWHPIPESGEKERQSPYPIGEACPYARCALLKEDGSVVEQLKGRGELLVAGDSLMAGYLSQPEQTQAVFISHNGHKWYTTGDLVEADENGNLLYRGRRGRMVKRRGYRIELGEIENALHQHEAIEQVACLAKEEDQRVKFIFAYYMSTVGPIPHSEISEFLARRLPDYMLPDRYILLKALPQTSSQKIDYPALKQML